MKLTKTQLREIIREEIQKLNEGKKMTKTDYRKFRMDLVKGAQKDMSKKLNSEFKGKKIVFDTDKTGEESLKITGGRVEIYNVKQDGYGVTAMFRFHLDIKDKDGKSKSLRSKGLHDRKLTIQ